MKARGADDLVHALNAEGVTRVFTLSGNHVMAVFDAAIDSGIDLYHARHEAAAVHMADAYARLTEKVGVALVTGGPGHANAVSALYTATMSESPVVLLSGHAPHAQLGLGAFQEMAQAEVAAPLCKASWLCKSVDDVASDLRKAVRIARSGRRGAVHLSLPSDCLEQRRASSPPRAPDASAHEDLALGAGDAARIRERLSAAKMPIILAGPAWGTAGGRDRARRLENALGIPVVGMDSPRGLADPSLGAFSELLAHADCILLLGKRLDFTLRFGQPPAMRADCELLQIDPEPQEIDRTQRLAGARLAASAVAESFGATEVLVKGATRQRGSWLDEVRSAIRYRPRAWATAGSTVRDRLHPVQALRPLQSLLDTHPDSVFISDGGEFGQWAQACLSAPNRITNGVAGAIGPGLPFALGARVAKPGVPIVVTMGDGTFGFHASELDTAVRYGLPFLAVIGNDARWNAEYQIQIRDYGAFRARGCDLLPARYDEVAMAFGAYGELVTDPGELLPAAERACEAGRPACLNVMIEGVAAPTIRR
jgi:acetolactate synthase-1/2/3 large subunit